MDRRTSGNPLQGVPYHAESERSTLGSMLRSADAAIQALEALSPADFYDPANREVFDAMRAVMAAGRPIDLTTLDAELSARGKLAAIGGAAYLIELSRCVPSSANIRAYIQTVEEKSTLRKLKEAAEETLRACQTGDNVREVLEGAEKRVFDISMRKGGESLSPVGPALLKAFEQIEKNAKHPGQINGVESGYAALDELLTGFHPGEMIVIAGRPAMGKTAIGMNIIENAAIRTGKRAAVFSLEMPAEQLAMRMLCTEARVDMQAARKGQIGPREWERLTDAMITAGNAPIYIDATPGATVSQIRSKARRLQMEKGLDIIMIDYLSLMNGEEKRPNRQEEVAQVSRAIKALALELNVPIIALQQLSRTPAGRADHRPLLSDIRESGAIEQDADVVMFIHREDYYNPDTEEKGVAELIVAKQRSGPLGTVKLGWLGEFTWFVDISPRPKEATVTTTTTTSYTPAEGENEISENEWRRRQGEFM